MHTHKIKMGILLNTNVKKIKEKQIEKLVDKFPILYWYLTIPIANAGTTNNVKLLLNH